MDEGTQCSSPSHRRQNCPWNMRGRRDEQDPQFAKTINVLRSDRSGGLSYQQRGTLRCYCFPSLWLFWCRKKWKALSVCICADYISLFNEHVKLNTELPRVYLGGKTGPAAREKALLLHSRRQFTLADFQPPIFCMYSLSCSPQGKTGDINSKATIGPSRETFRYS